jgi:hypothetical protein
MNNEQEITNGTAQIKEKCPWYWRLNAIIGERPSIVPTGTGNNSSSYDTTLLLTSNTLIDTMSSEPVSDVPGEESLDFVHHDASAMARDDTDSTSTSSEGEIQELKVEGMAGKKRKVMETREKKTVEGKKMMAKSGKSVPATIQPVTKKKKTGIEKLEALATKEEETTQKMLDLKREKTKGVMERALAKIKASAEIKIQRERIKAELAAKKMDHEFQLRMAQIKQNPPAQHFGGNAITASTSGWSDGGSVTPSTYTGDFNFDDNSSFYDSVHFSNTTLPSDGTTADSF